ncbi:serine/threonine-protein phosphatase 5-like isoform X2 [Lycium ferocissimum]|uniref:serine/threonine-protein phosphatase 5-like isoform X2 n=1 Tax=Lycium ferocissimum TaxID=112874 RepID=UPI002815E2BB|nr:serine/threonine-protein phosphatase 5-like isoform X2 [Lycium ferocissimum]
MFLLSFCRNLLFLLLIFFCIFKFSSDFSFSWLNFMAIEGKIKLLGHKYSQAIALYTQMIKLNSENVVYWANHVFAHIKLKEYCSVIEDGAKANEIVPRYSKGYYRREAAYLAMGSSKTHSRIFNRLVLFFEHLKLYQLHIAGDNQIVLIFYFKALPQNIS